MDTNSVPSTIGATYVEPSAEKILEPGQKIGDLYQRNMTQPFVLQRLAERVWWVQSFNYGTVFYVGDEGVLIFDTLEGVYDNIVAAVASVTDKPIIAAIYPHYHADHIGDIGQYVAAADRAGTSLRIFGSEKTRQAMELSGSSFPAITDVVEWPRGSFQFEDVTVELHGVATHTVNGREADAVAEIHRITGGGADYALDTTGLPALIQQCIAGLRQRGAAGILGASRPDAMIQLPANAFMQSCKTLMGVVEGDSVPDVVIPQLLDLYMQGRFPFDQLVRFYDLDRINEAAADAASGAVIKPILRVS